MCGFIAQLVEHRTGIAEVIGSIPVEALIFFRLLLSNCLSWKINSDDHPSLFRKQVTNLRTFARKFPSRWNFFSISLQSDNELLVSEMQKKLGVTCFVPEIKRVENYSDFEKLAHVIQHGLRGFIVKNTEGKSTEANNVSHILYKWVCCVNNS